MLGQNKLAWFVLGTCLVITLCSFLGFFILMARLLLKMARVKHLHGVNSILSDRLVEFLSIKQGQGFMELMHCCKTKCLLLLYCHCLRKDGAKSKHGSRSTKMFKCKFEFGFLFSRSEMVK